MKRLRFDQWAYSVALALVIAGGLLVVIGRWVETVDVSHNVEEDEE